MSKPQRMDGYIRVSRVAGRSGPGYISPTVQREQIEGWAKLRGVEIPLCHEDFDQSGGKLDRPGLNALLARIESGETEGVIVAKLDRLSRLGVGDALKLVERITDAGGSIAAVDLGLDPTTPFGEFGMTIMLALSRMERRRLADSWAVAQRRAVERGATPTRTPYGYRRSEEGVLEPDPAQSVHLRRAFQLAAAQGRNAALRYLEGNAPGRRWTQDTVTRVLARRVYLGESRSGEHVNTEAHEPLVAPRVWEAAQHSPRHYVRSSGSYPLSGIALCATCGAAMVSGPRSAGRERRYKCSAAQTLYLGPRCPTPASVAAPLLLEYVRERLRPILAMITVSVADGSDELALAERAAQESEAELEAFASDLTLRRALGANYREHADSRIHAVEEARATYRSLAHRAETRERISAPDVIDSDNPRLLAELLRGMDTSIIVSPGRQPIPDRVRIVPFDDELTAGK
jgi:site-specific DNA recombinase